jgi:hypothetical protein
MTRLHTSPLGAELDAAREDGRAEVIALARRRPPVRSTRLAGELTTEAPVDLAAVRAEGAARAVREMWWLDLEVGDGE